MIDTHTHIYGERFTADLDEVINRATSAGVVAMILPNEDEKSLSDVARVCAQYKQCLPLYGLHPTSVTENYVHQLDEIFQFAQQQTNVVGVGEIGLDLYWDKTHLREQKDAFCTQLRYAQAHNLPVSIHIRDAFEALYECLHDFQPDDIRGSLHCFSGTLDDALRLEKRYPNLYFGFNGTCTYKKSHLPSVAAQLPLEKLLLETDAPYLSPVPHRGKRNEPSYLPFVAQTLAAAKSLDVATIMQATHNNAKRLFSL